MSSHRKIVPWIIVCLMSFGLIAGAGAKANPDLLHKTLTHGGLERTYSLHFPKGVVSDMPQPLVFVLHGGGGSDAKTMAHRTGLNSIADREGFLVVYPAGIDGQWNDGRGKTFRRAKDNTSVEDVGFISSIIDLLVNEGQADPDRIYVMGLSNGGMMSLRIGIELGAKLAAIASGIANLPVRLSDKRPVQPLSVLMMNGTDDPLVPWDGGPVHVLSKDYGEVLSTEQTLKYWVDRAGLPSSLSRRILPDTAPTDGCRVEVVTYKKEGEPLEVILYAMKGGGHNLPGGNTPDRPRLVGRKCMDINGAEVIWEFFKRHSRATQGDPTPVPLPQYCIEPAPAAAHQSLSSIKFACSFRSCNTVRRESENPAHSELGRGAFLLPFRFISLTNTCCSAPWAYAPISRRALSEPIVLTQGRLHELVFYNKGGQSFSKLSWPCGVAEQCSRPRRKGAHCLSLASLRDAGVGEPRREPEGPQHGQHGFGSFCRNKRTSAAGPTPGIF